MKIEDVYERFKKVFEKDEQRLEEIKTKFKIVKFFRDEFPEGPGPETLNLLLELIASHMIVFEPTHYKDAKDLIIKELGEKIDEVIITLTKRNQPQAKA